MSMDEKLKSKFISKKRLENYIDFDEYRQNIYLSEKYYILLSILEISLRNSVDEYFKRYISKDWLSNKILHRDTLYRIKEAENKIFQRKEVLSHDKLIAELSFGFWTSLFRKSYSNMMRTKDIKQIFPNIPNKNEKIINRNILDKKLNHIRKFRNRIFHYEKIINKKEYENIENDIYELLEYFDREIYVFAKNMIENKDKY